MQKVYLIESRINGYITYKIGRTSRNTKNRLAEISTGNAGELEVIYEYPTENANRLETTLHNHFSYCRLNGEWFSDVLNVKKFVEACQIYDRVIEVVKKQKDGM